MNCKPGDIAIVVGNCSFAGRLVEVLYAAPLVLFTLPDGVLHDPCPPEYWVIESLGTPFNAPCGNWYRKAMHGCGQDKFLRPIQSDVVCMEQTENIGA